MALAHAIEKSETLQEIYLSHNLIGDYPGFSLIEALRNNNNIKILDLDKNLIKIEFCK